MNRRGCEFYHPGTAITRGGRAGSPNASPTAYKGPPGWFETVVNCEKPFLVSSPKERGKRRFVLSDSFDDLVPASTNSEPPTGSARRAAGRNLAHLLHAQAFEANPV